MSLSVTSAAVDSWAQISVKAAQTVWDRFAVLPKKLTPANVLKLKVDDMRAAGLSARKVEYLVDLALHFDNGALHVKDWDSMEDEEIIADAREVAERIVMSDPQLETMPHLKTEVDKLRQEERAAYLEKR
ncbi:MAG: hypothetical protein EBY07_03195 [Actinobacteria bacterium]|nr:hypothetical protein [Actinomycetota bacterium]